VARVLPRNFGRKRLPPGACQPTGTEQTKSGHHLGGRSSPNVPGDRPAVDRNDQTRMRGPGPVARVVRIAGTTGSDRPTRRFSVQLNRRRSDRQEHHHPFVIEREPRHACESPTGVNADCATSQHTLPPVEPAETPPDRTTAHGRVAGDAPTAPDAAAARRGLPRARRRSRRTPDPATPRRRRPTPRTVRRLPRNAVPSPCSHCRPSRNHHLARIRKIARICVCWCRFVVPPTTDRVQGVTPSRPIGDDRHRWPRPATAPPASMASRSPPNRPP